MKPIARLGVTALDCPQPLVLARFYSAVTGWEIDDPAGHPFCLCLDEDVQLGV